MSSLEGQPEDAGLIRRAAEARQRAYAPYSGFLVGVALLTESGQVYVGANVENAVYGLSMCAERSAFFQAVANGERRFEAIAVVTEPGVSPCGPCRQVMREFAGDDFRVIVADVAGNYHVYTLGELLPDAFTAQYLPATGE